MSAASEIFLKVSITPETKIKKKKDKPQNMSDGDKYYGPTKWTNCRGLREGKKETS